MASKATSKARNSKGDSTVHNLDHSDAKEVKAMTEEYSSYIDQQGNKYDANEKTNFKEQQKQSICSITRGLSNI